jgi:pyruvate dehydrogenase E1 component
MLLLRAFHETVDGEFQTLSATDGRFNREHFFNKYPELAQLTAHLSDDDIDRLRRGGHDPVKIYAAYHAATRHRGQPTVILAKTKKGYGMGSAQGRMTTHQQKKLDTAALLEFRDRFALPLTDSQVESVEFLRPPPDSAEMKYLHGCRSKLGGYLPSRNASAESLATPVAEAFGRFALEAAGKEMSTTMAFVRMLSALLKDRDLGPRVVPIIADEARTFGMADLFRQIGIYSPVGQLYQPEDSTQISFYREAINGQILEEGINEAGAIASWVAAGTSYSTNGVPMLPFYIFYSMFGFQRVGDLLWAAGDSRTRGFLLGATAGRTTLAGEGLQHQDGTSHLAASTVPNCRAYDPCYAYELAFIVEDGMRRLLKEQEDAFFYITVMNENYAQPSVPAAPPTARGATRGSPTAGLSPGEGRSGHETVREGVLRGMYRVRAGEDAKVRLLGAGTLLREALAAAEVLESEHGIAADVYSVTSFTELRREAMELERRRRLGMTAGSAWVEQQLPADGRPIIAASDYVRAVADLIRPYVADRYVTLGTDGFGRSDTRAALRAFFEVDRHAIVGAALHALGRPVTAPANPAPPWRR